MIYLTFKTTPVRVINHSYFKDSLFPIHKAFLRIIAHLVSILPIIGILLIAKFCGQTFVTYLACIPLLILQFFFIIKVHIYLLTLFKCQIAGDMFYVPDYKYLNS